MAVEPPRLPRKVVFGKAFLVEVWRGNREGATLFARAFLAEHVAGNSGGGNGPGV